ncbi:MAG: neutral/alkaline ceramidase [Spirochaetia bacterium]|nr:neutral/alkaline ceramidase [Spirochaetia bacterium]
MLLTRRILQMLILLLVAACSGEDSKTNVPLIPGGENSTGENGTNNLTAGGAFGGTCFTSDRFNLGRGIYDITGSAAELGMMGYAVVEQKTAGIHMRLRSRAFVVESPCNGKRIVYVTADLGQVFQSVKQGVINKLMSTYGGIYSDENVMIAATHTHSGPGGYSHYALYNLTILGYDSQNYNAIVDGIYQSIVRAHNNMRTANIQFNTGDVVDAGMNRSPIAYAKNPAAERSRYTSDTDKKMTLLKFTGIDGRELGLLNWFAVHATNIGNKNRLISGDNKGYAAYRFEKLKATTYSSADTFVAAFSNSNEGDVSPNLWGVPDNVNDFDRTYTIGNRQYDGAVALYNSGGRAMSGGVDYRHAYVDYSNINVAAQWTGSVLKKTCKAAIGMSMIAGSTEDGPGVSFVSEGLAYDGVSWPFFTLVPEDQACHDKKVVLLTTGRMTPYPWTPEVLPVHIMRLGSLAIVGVPFECTTMCGRRLRETVAAELQADGVTDVVIAGLANAYAGYVATPEEYSAQHYEGASTHFGPNQLPAMQQEYSRLARAMRDGTSVSPGPTPRNLINNQSSLITGVVFDDKPLFKEFGDVKTDAAASYSKGSVASVVFWGAHPRNNLKLQSTFLEVQRLVGSSWVTIASDWDPETKYQWARDGVANSLVTIKWSIPPTTTSGTYRIRHYGNWKSGWSGAISAYTATSRSFTVN